MANNQYVNKVVLGNETLIDLTPVTVTADKLASGYTALDASGALITGTASGGSVTVEALNVTQNGTYTAQSGKAYSPVTVAVPSGVDTSSDTVDAAHLLSGYTAHDSTGTQITGSYNPPTFTTQTKSATPTTSQQTITPDSGYDGLASVTVDAMPTGTAGTPTASKGSVSNHTISVTPSVTNTTGYITGGTKTGTAVSVAASELVSGTLAIDSSGTKDVTNYASASVAAGGATASASKGSVSNHSVSVTPTVTRTAGWVSAGTANGTAVTISASELVSGSETKTANGTYDVTNLASLVVAVEYSTIHTGSSAPTSSQGANGDVWLVV